MKKKEINKPELSIILPCYNEVEHINKSIPELIELLNNTKINYELILIDDCSKDKTKEEIKKLAKKYSEIRWKTHYKNIGRGGTVTEGIKESKGEIVGFMDIDLEISPEYILPSYLKIKRGYDIVTAKRIYKFNIKKIMRWITTKGYNYLMKRMLKVPFKDTEAGFKFFNKKRIIPILDEIKDKKWFWDTEIMVRSYYKKYKIKEIPMLFIRKNNKTSTVKLFKDSLDYFNNLIRFKKEIKNLTKKENEIL